MRKIYLNGILLLGLVIMSSCVLFEGGEYPEVELKNDNLKVSIYLPDAWNGYYRAVRFDWAGIIKQVEYKGHTYFGELKGTRERSQPGDARSRSRSV